MTFYLRADICPKALAVFKDYPYILVEGQHELAIVRWL